MVIVEQHWITSVSQVHS